MILVLTDPFDNDAAMRPGIGMIVRPALSLGSLAGRAAAARKHQNDGGAEYYMKSSSGVIH
jgi:hypothetical protein